MLNHLNLDTSLNILKYLSLKDLFNLRCVGQEEKNLVEYHLQHMITLNFSHPRQLHIDLAFDVLASHTQNLQTLVLNNCDWLTNEQLKKILGNNQKIRTLCLNNTNNITSVALQPILVSINGKHLRVLKLSKCYFLTSGALETLAFHHTHIEEMDLSYCNIVSERSFMLAIQKFRNLKVLSLAHVQSISDRTVCTIAKFSTMLKHLNLTGCNEVTDQGIRALALKPQGLESLMVRGCNKVTDTGLAPLRARGYIHIDLPRGSHDIPHRPFPHLFLQV